MKHIIVLLALVAVAHSYHTFLQITDLHLDDYYAVGSPNNAWFADTGMGACRDFEIPLNPWEPAAYMGDYNCDSPFVLLNKSLEWTFHSLTRPDFVIVNCDFTDHKVPFQWQNLIFDEINRVTDLFRFWFFDVPVYFTLGNHDTYPIAQLDPDFSETDLAENLTVSWKYFMTDDMMETFSQGGFYKTMLNNNTLLISLNSLYFDDNNLLIENVTDPSGQWEWLIDSLDNATAYNQNVWIIGHIPPASKEATDNFTIDFYNLVKKYPNIQNQFFGHSHRDRFMVYKDSVDGLPFNHLYVAPSMMPDKQFSSIREYLYNPDTMEVLDYNQYGCNLTQAILTNRTDYEIIYSAKSAYSMKDLSTLSWNTLLEELIRSPPLVQEYYNRYYTGMNYFCDDDCLKGVVNEIVFTGQPNSFEESELFVKGHKILED
jgi:hypothetical protein